MKRNRKHTPCPPPPVDYGVWLQALMADAERVATAILATPLQLPSLPEFDPWRR